MSSLGFVLHFSQAGLHISVSTIKIMPHRLAHRPDSWVILSSIRSTALTISNAGNQPFLVVSVWSYLGSLTTQCLVLCWCPGAVITKCHMLRGEGLKQQVASLQFWKVEVQDWFYPGACLLCLLMTVLFVFSHGCGVHGGLGLFLFCKSSQTRACLGPSFYLNGYFIFYYLCVLTHTHTSLENRRGQWISQSQSYQRL